MLVHQADSGELCIRQHPLGDFKFMNRKTLSLGDQKMRLNKRSTISTALAIGIAVVSVTQVFAANITIRNDPVLSCGVFVEGVIVDGVAARLEETLQRLRLYQSNTDTDRFRICFNSPGGSFVEGLKIASLLTGTATEAGAGVYGSAVPEGATCESACALAFMGGTEMDETGALAPDRILHPTARLGFHAPALPLPEGKYSKAEMDRAYGTALASISMILRTRTAGGYNFDDSLLEQMLETPRSGMFFIETLAQAALWGIKVHNERIFAASTEDIARNVCEAADSRLHGIDLAYSQGYSLHTWNAAVNIAPASTPDRAEVEIASGFGPRLDPGRTFPCRLSFYPANWTTDPRLGDVVIRDLTPDEAFNIDTIQPAMTFPPATRIAELAATPQITFAQFMARFGNVTMPSISASSTNNLTPPTYSSFWDHNGSRMGLVADGSRRQFYYAAPRAALVERGVQAGTLLFEGERRGNTYVGEARIFARPPCGEFTYPVEGPVSSDQRSVTMFGRAPRVNERCQVTSYRDDTLIFTLE